MLVDTEFSSLAMADPSRTPVAAPPDDMPEVEALVEHIVDEAVKCFNSHNSPYIYPSGVPGLGNCILGPRIPGTSSSASTTTAEHTLAHSVQYSSRLDRLDNDQPLNIHARSDIANLEAPHRIVSTGKKRKLSLSEPNEQDRKSKRISYDFNDDPANLEPSSFFPNSPAHYNDAEDEYEDKDAEEEHETGEAELARLIYNFKDIMQPYTFLHPTCAATEPAQKILNALSSDTLTRIAIMALIHDALEALRSLRDRQVIDIMGAEPTLQRAGLDSCLKEARNKVQQTGINVLNLEKWLKECNEDPNT